MSGLRRIKHLWEHDDADLFVFLDIYHADEQEKLRREGKRVWGLGWAEDLERNRWDTKLLMKELGLPVQHCVNIVGLSTLRDYLKDHENVHVKISETRGDMETWKHKNYTLSEPRLDDLAHKLGPKKETQEWLVEDDISPNSEVGFDGWTIDGEYPDPCFFGWEIKDTCFIGAVKPYGDLHESLKDVNAKLSPVFKKLGSRGFFSTEVLVTEDSHYLIDPTCRLPAPPNEVYQEIWTNWDEILWHGAEGKLVDPIPRAKFGVVCIMHSHAAMKEWCPILMPEENKRWVKLRYLTEIDGKMYFAPQPGWSGIEIGGVVGMGDTLEEAIDECRDHAAAIEADEVSTNIEALDDAVATVQQAEDDYGITLSQETLPSVESVAAETAKANSE